MNKISIVGSMVIVIGLLISVGAGAAWLATSGSTTSNLLQSNSLTYTVASGDYQAIGVGVQAGQRLMGTFTQTNGSSINFYLMTAPQQTDWGNCVPCSSPTIANISVTSYNFDWAINSSGTYYLVLDNSNGGSAVIATLSANSITNNSAMLYSYLTYLGIAVTLVGVATLIMGIRKK